MAININLNEKVAVITGASSGMGKAIALGMAAAGAKIVLASNDLARLKNVYNEIINEGHDCIYVEADVSNFQAVKRIFSETIARFQGLTYLSMLPA